MLSFTTLAPEIRSLIYHKLLQSALSVNERIVYDNLCPERCRPRCPHDRVFSVLPKRRQMVISRSMGPHVHLADIGDLLNLATTCHLLRSEILVLAWPNADIFIKSTNHESGTFIKYAKSIFEDHLSAACSNLIRTLHIDVPERTWRSDQSRALAALTRSRLPELETLNISIRREWRPEPSSRPDQALRALASLPSHVAIKVHNDLSNRFEFAFAMILSPDGQFKAALRQRDREDQACLDALRIKGRKRREKKLNREQGDELVRILKATAALRSLMVG